VARNKKTNSNGANVGYEAELRRVADALRGSMDAAEYKHVDLGLLTLRLEQGGSIYGKKAEPGAKTPEKKGVKFREPYRPQGPRQRRAKAPLKRRKVYRLDGARLKALGSTANT
jgi:hypothetical protein